MSLDVNKCDEALSVLLIILSKIDQRSNKIYQESSSVGGQKILISVDRYRQPCDSIVHQKDKKINKSVAVGTNSNPPDITFSNEINF